MTVMDFDTGEVADEPEYFQGTTTIGDNTLDGVVGYIKCQRATIAEFVQELDDAKRQVKAANERARQMAEDLAYAVKNWSATSAVLWRVQHELDALRNGQPAPVVVTLTDREPYGDGYTVEQ